VERDGEVKIWDATTGIELLAFRVTDLGGLGSMCLTPDGKRIAVSPESGGRGTIWTLPSDAPPEKARRQDPAEMDLKNIQGEWSVLRSEREGPNQLGTAARCKKPNP
jgi:WD40 repeat protein